MKNTLDQAVREVLDLEKQVEVGKKNSEELIRKAGKKIKELERRIKAGESTGDCIKDFVIMRYHQINAEAEATLRKLDERVRSYAGEFVLVVVRKEHVYGCRGIMSSMGDFLDYAVDEHLFLGVLKGNGLKFDLTKEGCALPTGTYARCWNLSSEEVDLVKGDYEGSYFLAESDFGLQLNKPLKRRGTRERWRGGHYQKEELALEVEVGDVAVGAWFEKQSEKHYLVVFQKMANALARPIPETPALRKELESRREAVRQRLVELEEKAARFQSEIDRIYGSKKGGIYSSGGAITVCEDDDDAFWISVGPRNNLKETAADIRHVLITATVLGMENEELVQRISKKCEKVPA